MMRQHGLWFASLALATTLAWADSDVVRELSEANLRSSEETAQLATRLLDHPEQLTPDERITAQAYLCEALTELDRADDAITHSDTAIAALPPGIGTEEAESTARLLACAGFLKKQKGRLADALTDFNRAQTRLDPHTMWLTLSYVLFRRAGLYDTLGSHAEALADLTRALELLSGHESDRDVEAQHNNITSAIAHMHLHRQEYDQALPYYLDLLKYTERIGDEHVEAIIQVDLGDCYRGLSRWQDATQAYARALDIGTRAHNQTIVGRANVGQGALAVARKQYAEGLAYFNAAHEAFAATGKSLDAINVDIERAQALADMQDWRGLARLGNELIAKLTPIGDKHLLQRVRELKARADEGNADLTAALADEREAEHLQKETQQQELDDELSRRSVQFDVAKLEDKAELLGRENEIAQLQIAREKEINLLQRGAIVLAIGVVLLLVINVRKHLRTGRLLKQLASEDSLTKLSNRRASLLAGERAFAASRADGSPLSLALLDIDHFKQINDEFGHAAGDEVLVAVAGCLRAHLRANDVCGRIGGEEFLLALPRCDMQQATATLERLRIAISTLRVDALADGQRFTVSAGLVLRTGADANLDALVRRADAALYSAKRGGRDRTVFHDDESASL